jgi:hypothetical protein
LRFSLYAGALVGTFLASFFATMWMTDRGPRAPEPSTARATSEKLAPRRIATYADLRRIADDIGLTRSRRMAGNIDQISRINDREVKIAGWLADPEGDATPLNVLVFLSGEMKAIGRTDGERSDVTWALGLAFGAEKNVGFQMSFSCRMGDEPVVVGVGPGGQYLPLTASKCP